MKNDTKRRVPPNRRLLALNCLLLAVISLTFLAWFLGWVALIPLAYARTQIAARNDAGAVRWIAWAETLGTRSAESELLSARIARRQGRLEDMARHLRKARSLGCDLKRLQREEMLVLAAEGRLEGIESELNHWLAETGGDAPEICDAYANGLAKTARYDDAARILQAWAADFPTDPIPHYRLGRMYQHLQIRDEALAEYRKAVEKDPKCYLALYGLARLLADRRLFRDALPYYQRCTELPDPIAGQVGMAVCLKSLGRGEEAQSLLEQAAAAGHESRIASYRAVGEPVDRLLDAGELGTLYTEIGEHAKAAPWLRRAVEYNPRDLVARFSLAVALRGLGHTEEAQRQFTIVQTARKALEDTLPLYQHVGQHPNDVEARFKLARILLDYESERMGLYYLRTVLTYDPDHEPTRRLLEEYERKSHAERLAAFGGASSLPPPLDSPVLPATSKDAPPSSGLPRPEVQAGELPLMRFVEVTRAAGLDFTYRNGKEAGELAYVETLGGGVAVLDYDRDGLPDLFFPGGGRLGPNRVISGLPNGLWRSVAPLRVEDVSIPSGVVNPRTYTHGVTVGDMDNDGFADLLITGYGGLQLLKNQGDGTFIDRTLAAGLTDTLWSTSAAWADFNSDGCLDLYVVHYVDWSWEKHPKCPGIVPGTFDICTPREFDALPDVIYYSNGDGTFYDATAEAGLDPGGKGLGVAVADVDNDGNVDIYVATDTTNNLLYLGDGQGRFEEVGFLSGTAVDYHGIPNGTMGVSIFDYNLDLLPDIWITNYENQLFGLYRNEGHGSFVHVSQAAGIGAMGTSFVGFGTVAADFDLDGDEDLVVANGHMMYNLIHSTGQQESVLLLNNGRGGFERIRFDPESYFSNGRWGRGLAVTDLDGDGDLDLVFSLSNEPAAIVANETALSNDWVDLRLIGTQSNRDCIGARAVLHTSTRDYLRLLCGGGSYMSQGEYRMHWGVPADARILGTTVYWPSGLVEKVDAVNGPGQYTLVEPVREQ